MAALVIEQLVDKVAVVVVEEETQRLLELLVQHQLDQNYLLVKLDREQDLELVVIDMVVTVLNLLVVAVVALVVVQMVLKILEVEMVVLVL